MGGITSISHQKLSQLPLNVKPEQMPDPDLHKLHHQVALVETKWIQTDQLIDVPQVQPMVPTRLVLLDQDLLPWNSEVDSVEDKQNKYDVSFTSSLWRSDYIFFFCDSKINLCKKRKE